MHDAPPLVLTLQLNKEAFLFFEQLRRQHFPAERNFLQAHLTLFHHLPAREEKIKTVLEHTCTAQPPIALTVAEVVNIGRGVAYKIVSNELQRLHAHLQQQWRQWLIPQDRQKLWPHVTVQNKVAPDAAKMLHRQLSGTFQPFTAWGTSLALWYYKGGPWELAQVFAFAARSPATQ